MSIKNARFIWASWLILGMCAGSSMVAADTTAENITEAKQQTQIWTTYALSPYLRAHDLKVSVHDGKATLKGQVDEGVHKDLAKQIALGVEGIKEVDNQIEIKADYTPPEKSLSRSYGEMIDDATITATVKSKLMWSKYTNGTATEVNTQAGRVSLFGTAENAAARDLAGLLATNTRGVVSVDNQLVVNNKSSGESTQQDTQQDISDGWITTKVKSTFLYSSNVDGSNIEVSTREGIVTLKGKLASGMECALAVELAKNVRGVKSVQSKELTI